MFKTLLEKLLGTHLDVSVPHTKGLPMTDENNYSMPMIRSSEFAANQIYKGLIKSNTF